MVLSAGDDHLVALSDDEAPSRVIGRGGPATAGRRPALAGVPDGQSHEVDGLGGVLGEDEFTAARPDEGGDGVAGVLEGGGGLVGELVGRAPRRAVGHAVEVGLRGDDAGGFLARGRPVQVGQSLAVAGGPLQVGEVGADRGDLLRVERAGRRRPGEWGRGLSHDVPFRFGAGRFRAWSPTAGAEVTRNLSPLPQCRGRRRRLVARRAVVGPGTVRTVRRGSGRSPLPRGGRPGRGRRPRPRARRRRRGRGRA